MPLDGLFVHALTVELAAHLTGGRITKVHQPYPHEIVLVVRNNSHNYRLLLSSHPTYARAQLTDVPYENPTTPPNFVLFLRRYLEGARLQAITQVANDRILSLTLAARNELGDRETLRLTLEMMGRHSNLFLVRERDQRILELIKHVPADQNRLRSLIPGATYTAPPAQNKQNPFTDLSGFATLLLDEPAETWPTKIQATYQGFSRDSAQSLAQAVAHDGDVMQTAHDWLARFSHPEPTLLTPEQGPLQFLAWPWPTTTAGQQIAAPTLGTLLDRYYSERAERERVHQQAGSLVRVVKNDLKKNQSKQQKLQRTLADTESADDFKCRGDLLMTYGYNVTKGQTSVTVPNYYDDNNDLAITLDPRFDGKKNAEHYYRRYRKLKNAIAHVHEQLALAQDEIDYLSTILTQLDVASPKDVADIRSELVAEGYLRDTKKKKTKRQPSQPEKFYSSDGILIEVGKNNLQNDRLSLKAPNRHFIWLHVQKIPGSHVLVHATDPSDTTITEAAELAAYFSKARDSANVPVDFLPVSHLRKPNGAKPGFVIFEGHQTCYVTPSVTKVDQLKANKNTPTT